MRRRGTTRTRAARLLLLASVAATARTAAFSPSSLGTGRATKFGSGGSGGDSGSEPFRNAARASDFSLSAASSAAASTATVAADGAATFTSSDLAVSFGRPILSPVEFPCRASPSREKWGCLLSELLSSWKTALAAFIVAAGLTLLPRLVGRTAAEAAAGRDGGEILEGLGASARSLASDISSASSRAAASISSRVSQAAASVQNLLHKKLKAEEPKISPMPFDGSGGWGRCSLRSITPIGSFEIYEFALPKPHYTVPLALGQQLDFCCLSSDDAICTGSFYPFGEAAEGAAGRVRVVLPAGEADKGEGGFKFVEVLRNELRPGDEVAVKPGKTHLTYHGNHVPVTQVVYLAAGHGVVPVIDQVRAITPRGASSVEEATVVWLNRRREDFDLAMDKLEEEYLKHTSVLAVTCAMASDDGLGGNPEVEEAVPWFDAGTMAVVSGPRAFAEGARGYLMKKGYPEDCICVLP